MLDTKHVLEKDPLNTMINYTQQISTNEVAKNKRELFSIGTEERVLNKYELRYQTVQPNLK